MPKKRKATGSLKLSSNLSKIMTERKLTLKEVGHLAGVSISVVESWLSGANPHDLHSVDQLSQKLGVPFKRLLLGIDEVIDAPTTLNHLFDENELFEGLVRLKVTRLNPKKNKE
ncbi:MAG: helix-turn-helix transcriptional regulator [Patescibacteria group bacterium]